MVKMINKKDCTGCHACYNICPQNCISMQSDNEGFRYPIIDMDKCIDCGLCDRVCPVLNLEKIQNKPHAYACINKDETIRIKSSSGGIFTLVAEIVIDNGGVVFGVGFNENFEVEHRYIETKEELEKLRGSKYVQSRIGDTFKQAKTFLRQGRKVLFTGTPCQIGGLKSYLGQIYDNLICIDIVCHGVPSPDVWHKYIEYREEKVGLPTQRIAFRSKNEGWKRFSVSFLFKNNIEYQKTLDKDYFMKAFLKNICLRPSCYECNFKSLNRQSDITLADFWGIWNVLPEMDDDKGTSLIFVNSDIGKSMIKQIRHKIIYKEVNIEEAVKYNSAAIKSVAYNTKRVDFFNHLNDYSFDRLVMKYCSDKLLIRLKRKVKFIVRVILIKTGLLRIAKVILGK
ncbi:F420H(2):quinone oxidoreductase [Vallitalea longa]|uniref:F420H(2):quinone oxidoreductase n=1 Tax=Vallitalea longa TaxID=2936439 RepID=A0A9W5YFF3_9FIRM|nr:Coenzyme F420 hydrogenase/dehydrogenase, beta subunit C-terminal domain [Vallitalea longa]GKX31766.1 F420H(2):quinone oxidoreductase [Vallitalea longa]